MVMKHTYGKEDHKLIRTAHMNDKQMQQVLLTENVLIRPTKSGSSAFQ
jgi:hypothetical protein